MSGPVLLSEQPPDVERDALRSKLTLARQSMLLADESDVLSHNRALVRAHNKRMMGADMPEDDATNIHIGDMVSQPGPAKAKPSLSPLLAGLIGAGLLATGIGGAAGAWFIADAIKNIKPGATTVNPVTPGDGNTKYEFKLLP